jgi:hypothetical protein
MELLWIVLFALLCAGVGGLVVACDALSPTEPLAPSKGGA